MSDSTMIKTEVIRGVTVVSFTQEEFSVTEDVMPEVSGVILGEKLAGSEKVLIDFERVEFFGSSFIEVMFRIWNRVKGIDGGRFGMCNLNKDCRQILEITNLTTVWDVFDSRDAGVDAMAA